MSNIRRLQIFIVPLCGLILSAACIRMHAGEKEGIHTPKPGSPERQEICDAAREYVLGKYANPNRPLPQPILFKIDHIAVQESYCNLEAVPIFKDGSYISPEYIEDIAFNLCLQKTGGHWKVIFDLSRTDVPEGAELQTLRANFPSEFPKSLLSPTWRKLLTE